MSADFLESVRFNGNEIIFRSKGGPVWSTSIVTTNNGTEQRNSVWKYPSSEFEIGDQTINERKMALIKNIFMAVRGQALGFRWKDWQDYRDDGHGRLGESGHGSGGATYQMIKAYPAGDEECIRKIRKPVPGSIRIYKNTVDVTSSSTIDYTTGMVTLAAPAIETDAITWKGEFDVPVRFTVDRLSAEFRSARTSEPGVVETAFFDFMSHPIKEIKY